MSIEELFLRQIDSVDGNIEVIVHPGQPMTCISFGSFVWQLENADRDGLITLFATVMADPDGLADPLALVDGDMLHVMANNIANSLRLFVALGAINLTLLFSTASLIVAALSEARQWQRTQLLAVTGAEVASC